MATCTKCQEPWADNNHVCNAQLVAVLRAERDVWAAVASGNPYGEFGVAETLKLPQWFVRRTLYGPRVSDVRPLDMLWQNNG